MIMKTGTLLLRFAQDQRGATAVEYGLIVAVISLGLAIAVNATIGDAIVSAFTHLSGGMSGEGPSDTPPVG